MSLAEQFAGRSLPRAIGDNGPPPPTPYEAARDTIEDLWGEASLWLDGAKVDSQELADGIGNLLAMLRKAAKDADAARRDENKPFDDGKAEVQARYKPILTKAEQAEKACKAALQPWLQKKADEIEAKARAAREEADRKRREAEAAIRAAGAADLAARAEAEAKIDAAKQADIMARKAANTTAKVGGLEGRSSGLRSTWKPELTDGVAAARHYWSTQRQEMETFLLILAAKDVAKGSRDIPGFEIKETRTVV